MKKITAIIIGLALAISAFAQDSLSFLTSKAALRAYAVDQANTTCAYFYSVSALGNTGTNFSSILPAKHVGKDILSFYTSQAFPITVLNPNDPISLYAWVANSDGDQLFYGYSSSQPFLDKGGYQMPSVSLTLALNWSIPVKFSKNISDADILYVDSVTGKTIRLQPVQAYGNKVYFPSDSTGHGFLDITFADGTQATYDLRNGGVKTSGTPLFQKIGQVNIENFLSYTNPSGVIIDQLQSTKGVGANRTYEIIIEAPYFVDYNVGFAVSTTEQYNMPIGYWKRLKGDVSWTYANAKPNTTLYINGFTNGVWYVVPDWNPSQFREQDPYIYNGGGGFSPTTGEPIQATPVTPTVQGK